MPTRYPRQATVTAWARLFRSHKLLLEAVERDLKQAGLPPLSWYDVLLEVHDAPAEGIRQYELGAQVLLPKYNLSRLLDRLEGEGLVVRRACPEDGRGSRVALTPAGRQLLRRMWRTYGDSIRERFERRLAPGEIEALSTILGKLTL